VCARACVRACKAYHGADTTSYKIMYYVNHMIHLKVLKTKVVLNEICIYVKWQVFVQLAFFQAK